MIIVYLAVWIVVSLFSYSVVDFIVPSNHSILVKITRGLGMVGVEMIIYLSMEYTKGNLIGNWPH